MIYPRFVKEGGTIGITAPSAGVGDSPSEWRTVLSHLEELGYQVIETENVRSAREISSSKRKRAAQLRELAEDPSVDAILCASGGDFLLEMLPEVDFSVFRRHPKWLMGMSDPTPLLYILTTGYDVSTLYGLNAKHLKTEKVPKSVKTGMDAFRAPLAVQKSYTRCWREFPADAVHPEYPCPVEWLTPNGEVDVSGRCLGGCIDVLGYLAGTPYDHTREFLERYEKDGVVWFFDNFALSSEDLYHTLFQMDACGWFENARGIVLGRTMFPSTSTGVDYRKALVQTFGRKMPLVMDADVGHTQPSMTLALGAMVQVKSRGGKGSVSFAYI